MDLEQHVKQPPWFSIFYQDELGALEIVLAASTSPNQIYEERMVYSFHTVCFKLFTSSQSFGSLIFPVFSLVLLLATQHIVLIS